MRLFIGIILSFVLFAACNFSKEPIPGSSEIEAQEAVNSTSMSSSYIFPYDLNKPSKIDTLPKKLKEISGLGFGEDGVMYAVQDENGSVFKLLEDGLEEISFRKDGDYEGIEVVGEHVYVVKSSGTIYKISNLGTDKQMREDFNDFLDDHHDVEGLAYEKESNCLLLVCKLFGKKEGSKRAIYKFDLVTNKVLEEPYFYIDVNEIKAEVTRKAKIENNKNCAKLLKKKGAEFTYAPSAIAIHPISQHVYITSSKGKMLIVVDKKGKLVYLDKLDKSIHIQPEGLAFDKVGNLYISNEGKEKRARLYRFDLK
jgi:uncharacterized protein YjiK